ncbi:LPS export ABC transporter ATP-binding protein [Candidatus Haliotispira prima]|uniref:LPS export ABC transporter ATP-binding protein n=1 Tax=Candidatus Haliotispira prima TaxID=3034016 RepID=A0ABY8MKA0_9SPIO|nr:LPS export ABC transporter ATP-binding protein [Candidatus Haliotispira prima]
MREGNSYLHVSRLHKRYGRKIAVEDISISLRQGEVVGLLGPNGAGKTTCFYMIAGFVHPTRGQVLLDECNISRWPMFKRARQGISYLPQESSIFRSLTVEQNLLAILEYRKDIKRRARMEMADFLMEHLGVLRLRKQKASTLSGGERRRVEVARALALEPRFLLLDEPFAGIDPIAVSEIKGIIRALAKSNIGVLITDHNVRDTLDITDRSYIVNLGEILVSGSRSELIASKAAREVYLGAEFS